MRVALGIHCCKPNYSMEEAGDDEDGLQTKSCSFRKVEEDANLEAAFETYDYESWLFHTCKSGIVQCWH